MNWGLTVLYWRLGLALNLARREFTHGQWGPFLMDLGIDKTRASKACAIQRTFKSEEAVADLTVEQAYGRRHRKLRRAPRKKRRRRREGCTVSDRVQEICQQSELLLEEVEHSNVSPSCLAAIDTVIEQLLRVRKSVCRVLNAK